MTSIVETLQQHLTPSVIQQISAQIGADPAATSNAVATALPALIGSLSHNASTPGGAAALNNALDAHDGSILDNLSSALGSGITSGIGGAILGHILGPKQSTVANGVGRASGLDAQQITQLLMILAPIVMGVLGRAKQQSGIDASQLPNVLQQSAQQMGAGGALGGDLLRAGESMLGGLFGKK